MFFNLFFSEGEFPSPEMFDNVWLWLSMYDRAKHYP